MEFNRKSARFFSMLGHRGTFVNAVTELGEEYDNLMVVTADMSTLTGLDRFNKKFPDKFLNVGIAEQNMIGISAGLAKAGRIVFATTYANFITMRSYEQIRINLGYMQFNVKIVGTGGGLSMGMSGNSHYGLEDIALMRAVPNMVVISPADGIEASKALLAAAKYKGPVYIRLSGGLNQPIVYVEDYDFQIGMAKRLREGTDVAIIATGTMVFEALNAAKKLEDNGISAQVIDMHTIKPLDEDMVKSLLDQVKLIVTVEEHSIIGGLGSAVSEVKARFATQTAQLTIGLPDAFGTIGSYEYLCDYYGLTAEKIAEKILDTYSEIQRHRNEI